MSFRIEKTGYQAGADVFDNWRVVDIIIPDIDTENISETVDGAPGVTPFGRTVGVRSGIKVIFKFYFEGIAEFREERRKIYDLFNHQLGPIRLFEDKNDTHYLEVVKDSITIDRGNSHRKATAEVELSTYSLPYFMSARHSNRTVTGERSFTYENPGDVELDHRYMDTIIRVEMTGSAASFGMTVNGEEWRYSAPLSAGDILEIKEGTVYLNGVKSFSSSTKNVFTFIPGQNDIQITGSTNYRMSIQTKVYTF